MNVNGDASILRSGFRWQDAIIEGEIPCGSSVLDLGCGSGELLQRLVAKRRCRCQGIELDPQAALACVQKGVPVLQVDLDEGLGWFPDQSFDYVVLEWTLQTVHKPLVLLGEMLRVGRRGIISFPNFAFWRVRLGLAITGRMPVTRSLPYQWYDSPNIHLFTLQDLLDWARSARAVVTRGWVLANGIVRKLRAGDNLLAEEVLLVVEKKTP